MPLKFLLFLLFLSLRVWRCNLRDHSQNLRHQRHLREINKKNLEISNFLPIFAPYNNKIMIVTNNIAVQNKPTKSVSTTERVMASTMSVDEYFDELISQVHKDYADL